MNASQRYLSFFILHPSSFRPRGRRPRRGVILLLVVSLLALFVLLGVTFSLVSIQALHGSKLELKVQQTGDAPETEMDLVMGQILYDTQARTALWTQSLLADLYGIDGIAGFVFDDPSNPSDNAGSTNPVPNPAISGTTGQLLKFVAAAGPIGDQPYPMFFTDQTGSPITPAFSPVPDYYVGRVLTFREGPLNGVSSRIIRYEPPVTGSLYAVFYVEMPKRDANVAAYPLNSNRFVINGAPFNGTGLGYGQNSGGYNLNTPHPSPQNVTTTSGTPEYVALLPHLSAYVMAGPAPLGAAQGGMDEGYDAADYQNIFMAMVPPGVTKNPALPILPSFHRPDLIGYWLDKIDKNPLTGQIDLSNPAVLNFLRQVIFRPMPWDHPNFTGSNPNFPFASSAAQVDQVLNALKGVDAAGNVIRPWDVDNDNDTIPDSIWIDPGLPIITMPDGRKVKRLAAILIKDLDGRINVNVHGNSQQWFEDASATGAFKDVHRAAFPLPPPGPANDWKAGGSSTNIYLTRGYGMGPAEVDFQHIFSRTNNAKQTYQNVINARYARGNEIKPGINGHDYYAGFRWMGLPDYQPTLPSATTFAKEWASPPDVWGRGAMGLDQFGQPYWLFSGQYFQHPTNPNATPGERDDSPYEVQYDYARAGADQPYLPREMERLLRYHDADSLSIQSRLIDVTLGQLGSLLTGERPGEFGDSHLRRELITTLSSYIPVPPGIHASHLRNTFQTGPVSSTEPAGAGYNTILDLYYRALQPTGTNLPTAWVRIVPFEFRHGELFNINRPFGNGVDDNNNYIADEPMEDDPANPNLIFQNGPTMEKLNDSPFPAGNPFNPGTGTNARVEYARHLFCLMMMLKDPTWQVQRDVNGSGGVDPEDTPRLIAQWAVNVVDFRDSDCIMTRFDYDPNPFDTDGWNPIPGTNNYVWGVERPELLITETLAFHDRRTQDLDTETPNAGEEARRVPADPDMPMPEDDTDYDQRLVPHPACFIELYNPWFDAGNFQHPAGGQFQRRPAELYATFNNVTGINLDRTAPNGTPVWRMLVIRGETHTNFADPAFNPDAARINDAIISEPNDVERAVFFTNPGTGPWIPAAPCIPFYSSRGSSDVNASGLSLLTPGQYAVVGSSGIFDPNDTSFTTYVGNVQGDTDLTQTVNGDTRKLTLRPGQQRAGNTGMIEFRVDDNSAPATPNQADPPASSSTFARQAVAVPIDSPRSFNITDPPTNSGYPTPTLAPGEREPKYEPPRDTPVDAELDADDVLGFKRLQDGTFGNYRTILLQRLADPTLPYDAQYNPYITIDRSSTDVTAFNGIAADSNDPANQSPQSINFQTFQRGGSHAGAGNWDGSGALDAERKLWLMTPPRDLAYSASPSPQEAGAFTTPHYFPYQLYHTLGYVNSRYGAPVLSGGYSGAPTPVAGTTAAFPWLTFNNRPFANAMELLLVPATNQYGLLADFNVRAIGTPALNEYETLTNIPFKHLLNFFQYKETTPALTGPHFSRLLDFVRVPSPFVNADLYYNSQHFNSNYTQSADTNSDPPARTFRPPFHKMSRFRDPGYTNINTVFDDGTTVGSTIPATNPAEYNVPSNPILQALFKGTPVMDPSMDTLTADAVSSTKGTTFVNNLRLSRQGYTSSVPYTASTSSPTIFGNPFRAQDTSDLFPGSPVAPTGTPYPPVTAGFLRPQGAAPSATPLWPPLFASEVISATPPTGNEHQDPTRNPYFRYQPLQRIGNLLSTQSNCYAIWITIGYFEVEENRPAGFGTPLVVFDAGHPDGYRLGQEVGIDTGEVTRHRGFYIVDRSIPVGFVPGSRLNTDDCILTRRLIE